MMMEDRSRAVSWESIASREYLSGSAGHQLSATALLPSPDARRDGYASGGRGGRGFGGPVPAVGGGFTGVFDGFDDEDDDDGGGDRRGGGGVGGYDGGRGPGRYVRSGGGGGGSSSRGGGLWECLIGCRHRVDQQLARRRVEQGLRLYNQHKQQAAVRKWRSALKRIRRRDDKFTLLGYLYQAHLDWGKYREALELSQRQLALAEALDRPGLRAEACLNAARAHERLGALERALAYGRHSLYNECDQCLTAGHAHLAVGGVYLQMGHFHRALQSFQRAHKIAAALRDAALELQVYVGLSELFGRLQDAEQSGRLAAKAYDLSRGLQLGDLNSRHHRAALLQMAAALRKQGEVGDAQDYCNEATRLALVSGDQATYARSIRIMGDIFRKKSEINKAFRQYEASLGASAALGDRLGQMEAMDGVARCLEALRLRRKICSCRPLEFNTRLLEVATSVGAKMLVRTVRLRLARIYATLGEDGERAAQERLAASVEAELELRCGACGRAFGLRADSLEALPCAHILHARCARELPRRRGGGGEAKSAFGVAGSTSSLRRPCPECRRSLGSRLHLFCCDDEAAVAAGAAIVDPDDPDDLPPPPLPPLASARASTFSLASSSHHSARSLSLASLSLDHTATSSV